MLINTVAQIPSSTGLLNGDCSVMPVTLFTTDHKATTIAGIVDAVKAFEDRNRCKYVGKDRILGGAHDFVGGGHHGHVARAYSKRKIV